MGDDESVVGANHAEELQADAALFLNQLKSMPMTFHRLCLSVMETQRLVLEVQAIWAYFLTIRPRFTALDSTSLMRKVDMDLVGCFTTNVWVTQQLHGAGVPVWILRPLDDLVHTRIDKGCSDNHHGWAGSSGLMPSMPSFGLHGLGRSERQV
ncbi:hypothetical protein F5146DRAFT_1142526 [Armillaria mellea]|nr:hypothetical protein F5146DRAFT_1142526 [Armillaria mellea]